MDRFILNRRVKGINHGYCSSPDSCLTIKCSAVVKNICVVRLLKLCVCVCFSDCRMAAMLCLLHWRRLTMTQLCCSTPIWTTRRPSRLWWVHPYHPYHPPLWFTYFKSMWINRFNCCSVENSYNKSFLFQPLKSKRNIGTKYLSFYISLLEVK